MAEMVEPISRIIASDEYWAGITPLPEVSEWTRFRNLRDKRNKKVARRIRELHTETARPYAIERLPSGEIINFPYQEGVFLQVVQDTREIILSDTLRDKVREQLASEQNLAAFDLAAKKIEHTDLFARVGPEALFEGEKDQAIKVSRGVLYFVWSVRRKQVTGRRATQLFNTAGSNTIIPPLVIGHPYYENTWKDKQIKIIKASIVTTGPDSGGHIDRSRSKNGNAGLRVIGRHPYEWDLPPVPDAVINISI